MKLPSYRELSKEQDKIYNLPLTTNYLISGPPGTGKTVIALYRASMYRTQGKNPVLLSYSRLLSSYILDAAKELDIEGIIRTFHKWVYDTYEYHFGEEAPEIRKYTFDWKLITPRLFKPLMKDQPYLLIDEGQDLPPDFYTSASVWSANLTVFADENQRIMTTQSTFADIKRNGGITIEHKLTRNYRNTEQIAKVAACFHADMVTGIPDIPEKQGPLPVVQNTRDIDDAINLICRFEKNNSSSQIGVFYRRNDFQQLLLEKFKGKTQNPVEFYRSGESNRLSFNNPGIKLISYASAKGLEFDAVFLPELQRFSLDPQKLVDKMTFYVLLSRAREYLYMLYSGTGRPDLLNLIPGELIEYR
jgi:superfamily I DNA/RNA helicase